MIYAQIRAFDAVAREGSFSRAALVLGLTQPAVTIQVKALEDRHGLKLLHREGRRVRLTEAGRRLYTLSRQLASLDELIEETLSSSQELQGGSLRLAVDGPHIVMGLFARFMSLYPRVRLSVSTGNSRIVRQALLDRHADIGILPGIAGHPQVDAMPLWHHRGVLIVANTHPWAKRTSISLAELNGEPMIGREDGSMTQALVDNAFARQGAAPRYVLELGSREAICEAVAAGLGHGIIWELEAFGSERFTTLQIEGDVLMSTDYVACLKSERMRSVVKAFFDVTATLPADRSDIRALRSTQATR
ncbi:MAG TPA: LysR substrate-binding domain-containing protein [Bosea sp. (in: a-proteobacteria)]|jgi:aminoethylphosphonate catabolism LysR family transcriptional regulator|uniref:LysR substrate-binding domain-containing protein n=1 Tax=Bosea sp. (in: a-proteobacteria) TaxID=1871050 RepID=UPI002E10CA61|nr:LysR substrate-binding domain-containing protein [Bosea sp. (in: a-proteobacteria)]